MRALRNPRFWILCIAAWIFLALAESVALHFDALRAGRASQLDLLLLERLTSGSAWILIAAVVHASMVRALSAPSRTTNLAWRFCLLGAVLAPLHTLWGAVAYTLVQFGNFSALGARIQNLALTGFMWDSFIYTLLAIVSYTTLLRLRSARHESESTTLRARLAQAELELLRAQLEPHFLFNALNTISGLIRAERPDAAMSALARLSELLRYVIEASRQERVPLAWELQFVANYLELQQVRYGPRLQYSIHEDAAARSYDVPPLLLQPLIENAVVHGAARSSGPATIDVRVALGALGLRVDVHNSRSDSGSDGGTGVGLTNTRQRLERMYGDTFQLNAGPEGEALYRVSISLPPATQAA